jgi:RimJ/RimL family protein N-acetyltransferase
VSEIEMQTERLTLRRIDISDAEALFSYRSDPAIYKYHSFQPKEINEVKEFIRKCSKDINVEGTWFQFGVYRENKLIGDIGLHFLEPQNAQVEIGYTISKNEQRKGYGKESVLHVLRYLFDNLKKHRVIACLDPNNETSIRLLEKINFRKEGCFRKSVLIENKWEDNAVYAMLQDEWLCLFREHFYNR